MSSKRHSKISLKNNNSPATSYLLSVIEQKTHGETFKFAGSATSRVSAAFSAFDEILPHCGIYTPVLKIIKEELEDAVYSDTYTTSVVTTGTQSTLERVPHFILLQRLHDAKTDSKEVLEECQEAHREKILKLQQKIDDKKMVIMELEHTVKENTSALDTMDKILHEKEEIIERLKKKIQTNEAVNEEQVSSLKENIRENEGETIDLRQEIEDLTRYKVSYHNLKDTFDLPPDKRPRRGFRRPVISTKKTQLLSSIEAASKLEQQMVEVQTKSLEEYDVYLEEVKGHLSSKKFSDNEADHAYFTEELQLESLGDEMRSKLKNFQRLISATVVELELVRQHRDTLQSQLSQMEQAENPAAGDAGSNAGTLPPSSMAGGPGSSRMMIHDEVGKKTSTESQMSMGSGLEEDTTPLVDPSTDPFNPQERLLSKYSAMLYTSVNSGKTFDEITVARFCKSCGEKTAVCPHKVTKSDLIVPLPQGCTHIKVSRPMVRVALPSMPQNGVAEGEYYPQQAPGKWYDPIPQRPKWNDSESEDAADLSVRRQLAPLWQNAKRRAGIDAVSGASSVCATRDLDKMRIFSLMEQFYASIIWNDDHISANDEENNFREYLYNFMSERYQEEEISTVATYDLITAIVKYAEQDKTVLVAGLALAGLVDGSTARYVLVLADLIAAVTWSEVSDFAAFAQVLFPSLEEEDLEMFVMEYTAFSENKISKTLVLNYLVHMITKNKEPRFLDAESKLSSAPMKEKGNMTPKEFTAAMENIAPLANEQLLERLTKESMLSVGSQVVPLKRLSSVAAYVCLLQVWQLLRDQINTKVMETCQQHTKVTTKLQTSRSLVPETGQLITMSQVKMLAGNISRLRHSGNNQSQQSYNDDIYWQSRPDTRDSLF